MGIVEGAIQDMHVDLGVLHEPEWTQGRLSGMNGFEGTFNLTRVL